jgi:hypothetical protein
MAASHQHMPSTTPQRVISESGFRHLMSGSGCHYSTLHDQQTGFQGLDYDDVSKGLNEGKRAHAQKKQA